MGTIPANDRRTSQRHWTAVPVVIRYRNSRIDGVTINLSSSGMYLFAAAHLPLKAEIDMEFRAPEDKELIAVRGIVQRRALYLYGIEFLADKAQPRAGEAIESDHRVCSRP
ncbi:MAG: PilZ domain-containing protein [Terriglobales bacterium]